MTQLFIKSLSLLSIIVVMFATTSCDTVLQYPDGEGIDPTLIKTRVELAVDFTPINDPLLASYAEARAGDFDVRYQVAIYAVSGAQAGKMVERKVWTSNVIEAGPTTVTTDVDLHAERYEIYAWIDFVPSGSTEDYYYITTDPRKVFLADPNICGLDTRDAFSGKTQTDLTQYRDVKFAEITIPVAMERPFGKFKIVTTDVKKFLESYKPLGTYSDIVPAQTKLKYTTFFPTAYNLDTRLAHIDEYKVGINHIAEVTEQEDNKATLSYNYVFVCNNSTVVTADIDIWNKDGEYLTTARNIRIPIRRNRLTIVQGEFLTKDYGTGGTGIDDSFDDEFVIIVPD
ncbi:MAG: hypothetical protein NC548_39880 [Lachnospiraceae bacterium]|nr:hypothetical protein [Lachnospiraceae bacterium]